MRAAGLHRLGFAVRPGHAPLNPAANPGGGARTRSAIDREELERWYALYLRRQARRLVAGYPVVVVEPAEAA